MATVTRFFSANFGAANAGLSTVGYTMTPGGSRVTAGVTETRAGSGIYGATVTYQATFAGAIVWDAGTTPNKFTDQDINPTGTDAGTGGAGVGADAQDLCTTSFAAELLAAAGVAPTAAQTTALQDLVTAASQEICRYCRRYFALNTYDEVLTPYPGQPEKGEPDWVDLTYFPINAVTRLAGGRSTALAVAFTGAAEEATVQYTFTGDSDIAVTRTGLTLISVASGVKTMTAVVWTLATPFTTVSAVAAAVNAVAGWTASVATGFGPYSAALLYGTTAPFSALGTPGVSLPVFATGINVQTFDARTGVVYLPSPGGGPGPAWAWPASSDVWYGGGGYRPQVRVTYTAGWAVIPLAVQRACGELVKVMLDRLRTDGALKSETAKDYTYAARDAWQAIPPHVAETLNKYRVLR